MKAIKIEGFTTDCSPTDKPALCIFGDENVGKTHLACSLPCDDGAIGYMALDKNAKRTIEAYKELHPELHILINKDPLLSHQEAIKLAMLDSAIPAELDKIKAAYTAVLRRTFEFGMALAAHPDVESIAVDTTSQLKDWINFAHFGRKNQIKPTSRGAANQDMIDFINALSAKNVVLIHRAAEIWKDTGATDKEGNKIQAPSGKFKPDGFAKIGGFVTAVIELTAKRTKLDDLAMKYRAKVVTCKGNTLLEGQDLHESGVSGENITWENIMTAIGL